MHGLPERLFDKRWLRPANVARLAQHGAGIVSIQAGEGFSELSASWSEGVARCI